MRCNLLNNANRKSQIGYACYKPLCGVNGTHVDYELIEVNSAFEQLAELSNQDIIGKKISAVLPCITHNNFNWKKAFGQLEGCDYKNEFEVYKAERNKHYKIYVFNTDENYFVAQFIDITKEKGTLIENQRKVNKLNNILQGTHAGTWEWNVLTGEQIINERWAEIIGYTIDELAPVTYKTFIKHCHPEDYKGAIIQVKEAFEKKIDYYDIQVRMKHKGGWWIWVNSRGTVNTWDSKGKPLQVCGTHIDITNYKLIEEAKLESEEYYKRIIDASKDAIIVMDSKGGISMWNSSAEALFGYKAQEVMGENVHKLIAPPASQEEYFNAFSMFRETGKGRALNRIMEVTGLNKSGQEIAVELSLSPMKLADGWSAIGIIRNIAERKIAEKALEENENRLIEAQQMAHIGNWELDLATSEILASKEAFNIYGIQSETPYLPLEVVQKCVKPEYRQSQDEALINLIVKEENYDQEYVINNSSTGTEVFVHSKGKLIRDKKGKVCKVRGTIQDITEWKKKEAEITYLSYHDQLTGLYNRRFFEEELERLDTRRNLPLTLVMGDVNGLKLINDSFGHVVGDEYLKRVAELISKACRADDIIARLSGDEFTIILPKTDGIEAEKIIKRIHELSSNEKIGAINVSISFGHKSKIKEEEDIQEVFKKTEDHMYKNKLYESFSVRSKTIDLIMSTLYEKNNREMLHSQRVGVLCKAIAEKMDFDKDDINKIRIAGLMHDIGKIGIDEEILNAKRRLNEEEWKQIRKHSEIGYRILSSANEFSEIAEYVLEHQERWDGTGYPKGLKGDKISIQARIIAVADAFDAMTGERTYGKVLTTEEAMQEIRRFSGTQFDPDIVRMFDEKVMGAK